MDDLYNQAYSKFELVINLNPDMFEEVWLDWGSALFKQASQKEENQADILFTQACDIYEQATKNNPDDIRAWFIFGGTLVAWARKKTGKQSDTLFTKAYSKYEQALTIDPNNPNLWGMWGEALIEQAQKKSDSQADTLFTEAYAKYKRAVAVATGSFTVAVWYYAWGNALMKQARQKKGAQREDLLQQAEEKLIQAEKKLLLWQADENKEYGAYTLACIYALRGNEAQCKRWLQVGEEAGILLPREYAMEEEAFASVRDKEWFKQIRWKGE